VHGLRGRLCDDQSAPRRNQCRDSSGYIAGLPLEVILLGTGAKIRFPHPRLSEPLRKASIGFEVMDTQAACRTYNILVGEGRRVGAALFID
jgi:uncharacterized protein